MAPAAAQRKQSKGPRALALLEFDTKGDIHVIPVTVMVGGEFYDGGAYKASPVPMALEPETVYEGEQTGASQGLYTIVKAHKVLGIWAGEGIWETGPPKLRASSKSKPTDDFSDDIDKPPVLRKPGSEKPKAPAPPTPPAETKPADSTKPAPAANSTATAGSKTVSDDSAGVFNPPLLRRGKPAPTLREKILASPSGPWTVARVMTAISDAGGPDPRSYTYDMKPDEEAKARKQILALAATELQSRASGSGEKSGASRPKPSGKKPQPVFDDVQLHVFDIASNNEPVFVLSAKAKMPQDKTAPDLQYFITLVSRVDIYGEMHKAFASVTDAQHLDLVPRYELIDAVDADGDGYAELLFRTNFDSGHAFSVYRVIGNQLWPLFEGKP